MNENIRSTDNDWKVEHTDREQEKYADSQSSEPVPDAIVDTIVAEESVKADIQYIAGIDPISAGKGYETGPATLQIGFRDKNGNISYSAVPRDVYNYDEQQSTRYQHLLQEQIGKILRSTPSLPDNITYTSVMEKWREENREKYSKGHSIHGNVEEQIEKIRERNVPKVSKLLVDELMEKVPAEDAIQHDMREFDVYNTLEQILADIWKIRTREITIQELAMKVQRSINNGAYIQQDGTK